MFDVIYRLWSVETGKSTANVECKSSVRCCNFSYSGNQAAYSTDKAMGHDSELFVIDVRTVDSSINNAQPILSLPMKHSKVTAMFWVMDEIILTGHENGLISYYDTRVSTFSSIV